MMTLLSWMNWDNAGGIQSKNYRNALLWVGVYKKYNLLTIYRIAGRYLGDIQEWMSAR